jgi:predicted GNAT family acetyltransferase
MHQSASCQYPRADQENWLEDYFNMQVDKGYVYGVYVGQQLVSATEIPDLPYMRDVVAEPGINTLSEYRRQGYAKVVVGALLKHLLKEQKTPLWFTNFGNIDSQKLAESWGYVKFADVITVTR